jgi:hypothetical protein
VFVPGQAEVRVPLKGKGLKSTVTLCYALAGGAPKCLDEANRTGQIDFGALDEGGAPRKATVTLKNEGNVQVAVAGALPGGATTRDFTAIVNPCKASPPRPDFSFTPSGFDAKLPADATPQNPNPSRTQTLEVSYSPHHENGCIDDLSDTGEIRVRAGSGANAPVFNVSLLGTSKVGLVKTDNLALQVSTPVDVEYRVFNVGPGPLRVKKVEIVEGDAGAANAATNCTTGCSSRKVCGSSSAAECAAFKFNGTVRTDYDIAAGSMGKPTAERVTTSPSRDLHFQPPGGTASALVACVRIETTDPFNPAVCGDLKWRN